MKAYNEVKKFAKSLNGKVKIRIDDYLFCEEMQIYLNRERDEEIHFTTEGIVVLRNGKLDKIISPNKDFVNYIKEKLK